jgi:hypothetical protein
MSDTPETDNKANSATLCDQCVPADFARSLERERDEARRDAAAERNRTARELNCMSAMLFAAESARDDLRAQFSRICTEAFANDDTIGGETYADYIIRKVADAISPRDAKGPVVIASKRHMDYLYAAERDRDNLRQVIVAFCEDHKWAATDWKNQARVKPLFDIEKTYKTTNE